MPDASSPQAASQVERFCAVVADANAAGSVKRVDPNLRMTSVHESGLDGAAFQESVESTCGDEWQVFQAARAVAHAKAAKDRERQAKQRERYEANQRKHAIPLASAPAAPKPLAGPGEFTGHLDCLQRLAQITGASEMDFGPMKDAAMEEVFAACGALAEEKGWK